ncbi:MAG TPA: XRE family transcriptional regulator [Acidimicrobiales bacterium]|nr:XRE family transcriptional regulator [Acidimicrobiales bacterium]
MPGRRAIQPALSRLFEAVGVRARSLRVEHRLTLDELSERSGVSRRMIALLEAGEANPSLATLDRLARALGTDFASLVVARAVPPLVAEASEQVAPVWEDGHGSTARLLVSHPGAGTTELWQWELVPGARYDAEPDPPGSEEIILVSSGRLVIQAAGEDFRLAAGGYLRLPTQQPYSYANRGRARVNFIRVVVSP